MILLGFIGTTEVVVILIIALLVFGPQKLPEVGRQIGSLYQELNRMRGDVQRALDLNEYTRYDSNPYNSYSYDTPAETHDAHETVTPQIEAPTAELHDGVAPMVAPPGPQGTVASSSPFAVRASEAQWGTHDLTEPAGSVSTDAHPADAPNTTSTTTPAVEPAAVPHKESNPS